MAATFPAWPLSSPCWLVPESGLLLTSELIPAPVTKCNMIRIIKTIIIFQVLVSQAPGSQLNDNAARARRKHSYYPISQTAEITRGGNDVPKGTRSLGLYPIPNPEATLPIVVLRVTVWVLGWGDNNKSSFNLHPFLGICPKHVKTCP